MFHKTLFYFHFWEFLLLFLSINKTINPLVSTSLFHPAFSLVTFFSPLRSPQSLWSWPHWCVWSYSTLNARRSLGTKQRIWYPVPKESSLTVPVMRSLQGRYHRHLTQLVVDLRSTGYGALFVLGVWDTAPCVSMPYRSIAYVDVSGLLLL